MTIQIKTQQDLQRLIALSREFETKQIEKAKNDFKIFCKLVVNNIEKFNLVNLRQDWVSVVIEDFIDLLDSDVINRGIYNIPPRTGKTTLLTIFGSAFLLGSRKNIKIAIVNANQEKVNEINQDIKNIVNSEIYQQIFGVNDVANKNAVRLMRLNNGSSITFKVSGSNVIGSGYHFLFFDDYLNPNNEKSEARKEQAKLNLSSFLSRKEYNPMSKIIVIEQRIGIDDTTAICQSKWKENGIEYNHISLPYFFTEDIFIKNYVFREGDYLDIKFNEQDKKEIIADRNTQIFETQYQQNPVITDDTYINREDIRYYEQNPEILVKQNYFDHICIACDTASKTKSTNDFSAFICGGIKNGQFYIIDVLKIKMTSPDLFNALSDFYLKYRPHSLLIEDKSSGESIISEINKRGGLFDRAIGSHIMPFGFKPIKPVGTKEDRLLSIQYLFKSNNVLLPKIAEWLSDFENEICNFPFTKHDDQLDAMVHFLREFSRYVPTRFE